MTHDCAPRRAAPLPPDERRAAILAAVVPLLRERGADVSTRELAEAAGVAEGTLFRVFPDKGSLVHAALAAAMDPEPLIADLARIDLEGPLEVRLRDVLHLAVSRTEGIIRLMSALPDDPGSGPAHAPGVHRPGPGPGAHERSSAIVLAVAAVFERDRDHLRITPLQLAGLIRAIALGSRMPGLPEGARPGPADLAACLVRGLGTDEPAPAARAREEVHA